jgi:hypothetical protein
MLNKNIKLAAFGLMLGATLALPFSLHAQEESGAMPPNTSEMKGVPVPGASPGMMMHRGMGMKDPHPAVHRAEMMLARVKFVLEKDGEPDPGNHRADALKNVNSAIDSLKSASDALDKAEKK